MRQRDFDVPIAIIGFNRPNLTSRVMAAIEEVRPSRLFFICDGPRENHATDTERCGRVREIASTISWDCDVSTNFSAANLGCGMRVSTGLDWVFRSVDRAIVLEDDCLPHQDFFRFCREMLATYEDDERVGMVGGTNFGFKVPASSYFFTKYIKGWGWATWRRVWSRYDFGMRSLAKAETLAALRESLGREDVFGVYRNAFLMTASGQIDTWDYQLLFSALIHQWLCVLPTSNLVTNIGFGADATHTCEVNAFANLPLKPLQWPLISNPDVVSSDVFDDLVERHELKLPPRATSRR